MTYIDHYSDLRSGWNVTLVRFKIKNIDFWNYANHTWCNAPSDCLI